MFLDLQLNYLLWLQNIRESLNGFFDPLFLSLSLFGSFILPICTFALIYWGLNKKVGEFIILSYSFSMVINQFAKMLVCINRPWVLNEKIKPVSDAITAATGFSFPSGHTANAISIWGGLCAWFWDNKKIRYTMIILVLLIGFSRNYLGVHTPQDVLFSFFVGVFILIIFKKIYDKVDSKENNDIKICAAGILGVVIAIGMVVYKYNILEGQDYLDFVKQMPSFYFNVGLPLGCFSGWCLCRKFIPFGTDNMNWVYRLSRIIPGLIFTLVLMLYETPVFVQEFGKCKGNFFGALIVGLFVTFIYPWIFTRFEKRFNLKGIESIWNKN